MSRAANDKDLERTEELFAFLQGKVPKGCKIPRKERPKLTADQAWTVIWYLGNLYWQVTDRVHRCDVCSGLYHSWQEGGCLDYGAAPYFFCDSCLWSDAYARKADDKRNPDRINRKEASR